MSNSIYWRPASTSARPFPIELKSILAMRFFEGDGSLSEQVTISADIAEDIAWLEGVHYMCADPVTSAALEDLLAAIRTYKRIRVWCGVASD